MSISDFDCEGFWVVFGDEEFWDKGKEAPIRTNDVEGIDRGAIEAPETIASAEQKLTQ